MLLGEYKHTIDKKGRVFIPAKLKEALGENFVISKGIGENAILSVYSMDEWARLDEKIKALGNIESLKVRRFLYSGASTSECDTQGRILIPQRLREYAELVDNAYIVGMSDHIEIWNTELWSKESGLETPDSIYKIMEGLNF